MLSEAQAVEMQVRVKDGNSKFVSFKSFPLAHWGWTFYRMIFHLLVNFTNEIWIYKLLKVTKIQTSTNSYPTISFLFQNV